MRTKSCKLRDLQTEWYKKLEKEGFQDIEIISKQTRRLKEVTQNISWRGRFNIIKYETTLKYYEKASAMIHTYQFKDERHKKVWQLHCYGYPERKIALTLGFYKKSMIHHVIAQIASNFKKK